ncbi:superoxide dismutase [Candidatus Woesearchaeota archaeon]|nr:superoxide dismutase [Candidatus Woesearchaeota archaeon]
MHKPIKMPFNPDKLKGISKKQITYHFEKHYKGYVKGRNKIEKGLAKGDINRGNKKGETHNASGQVLHETYFSHLGGKGGEPKGNLMKKIKEDFGSFAKWKKRFLACTKAARGWVLLCYDWKDHKLHNYAVDFHDQGAVWSASPILAIDLWEHAYYFDYGPDKSKYIEAFFNNLNWKPIEERFEKYNKK